MLKNIPWTLDLSRLCCDMLFELHFDLDKRFASLSASCPFVLGLPVINFLDKYDLLNT